VVLFVLWAVAAPPAHSLLGGPGVKHFFPSFNHLYYKCFVSRRGKSAKAGIRRAPSALSKGRCAAQGAAACNRVWEFARALEFAKGLTGGGVGTHACMGVLHAAAEPPSLPPPARSHSQGLSLQPKHWGSFLHGFQASLLLGAEHSSGEYSGEFISTRRT